LVARLSAARVGIRLAAKMLRPRSKLEWIAALMVVVSATVASIAAAVQVGVVRDLYRYNDVIATRAPVGYSSSDLTGSEVTWFSQDTMHGPVQVLRMGPNTRGFEPPGTAWPAPGEVYVSPALAAVLGKDALVDAVVVGKVVGQIPPEALTNPDELLAYVGVDAETIAASPAFPIARFGNPGDGATIEEKQFYVVGGAGLAVLALGAVSCLGAVARLSEASRRRRLAAVVLIGARPGTVARIGAASAGVLALLGCVVGLGIVVAAARFTRSLTLVGTPHWSTLLALPLPWQIGIAGAIVGLVVGLAMLSSRRDAWAVRRRSSTGRASLWRLVPLAAGAAMLARMLLAIDVRSSVKVGMGDRMPLWLFAAVGLVAVGAWLAEPVVAQAVRALSESMPLAARVAVARTAHDSGASRWVSLSLVFGLLGFGLAAGMGSGLASGAKVPARTDTVVLVLPAATEWPDPQGFSEAVDIAFASSSLVAATATGLVDYDPDTATGPMPEPTSRAVKSPDDIGEQDEVAFVLSWEDATKAAAAAAAKWRSREYFPQFIVSTNQLGAAENASLVACVSVGLILGIALICLGVGFGMIGLQIQRDDADSALLAIGMPRGKLRMVRACEVMTAMLPMGLLGVLFGCVAAVSAQHVQDITLPIDWGMLLPLVATLFAATGILSAVAALATPPTESARVRRD
jgi:hypothetical protein